MEKPTLNTIKLHFSGQQDRHYSYNMASLFQGALMQTIDSSYAAILHESSIHPYSQYLQIDGTNIVWIVNTMSEEAYEQIGKPLLSPDFQQVELKTHKETLQVTGKEVSCSSYENLIRQFYFGDGNPILRIRFLTPTSFKSNGEYCIFPTTKLIFQSLMMKYDAGSDGSTIYSEDLVDQFDQYTSITNYRLRSTLFYLSGARIPAFIGDVTIRVRGSSQLANIARMLAVFGEYSGVGIKTGMGMGAISVLGCEGLQVQKSDNEGEKLNCRTN